MDRYSEEPSNVANFSERLQGANVVPMVIQGAKSLFRSTPPASPSSFPKSSKLVTTWQRDFQRRIPTDGRACDRVSKDSKAGSGESIFEVAAAAPPPISLEGSIDE